VPASLRLLRLALLAILLLGLVGTGVELLLLKHTDGIAQLAPLGLIGLVFLALIWYGLAPGTVSTRAFQATLVACLLSGAVGVVLHYRGNVEWELERMPGVGGWELFKAAMMGATPSLAPGMMFQIGLVGLLFTYLRPVPGRTRMDPQSDL